MNGRKAKEYRRQARQACLTWLHSLMSPEEAAKINIKNFMSFMPKETHIHSHGIFTLIPNTYRWTYKKIKKNGNN